MTKLYRMRAQDWDQQFGVRSHLGHSSMMQGQPHPPCWSSRQQVIPNPLLLGLLRHCRSAGLDV